MTYRLVAVDETGELPPSVKLSPEQIIEASASVLAEMRESLSSTYARGAVAAADYGVTVSNTGAANKAALQTAVNSALALGLNLYLPEGTVHTAGTVEVAGSLRIFGAGRDRCTVHQDTKPLGIFHVSGQDVTFSDFTVEGDGLDMTGHPLTTEASFQHYVGIRADLAAHGLTVERMGAKDIYCLVLIRDNQTAPGAVVPMQRFVANDLYGEGVWSALHGGPFIDPKVTKIRGTYQKATGTPSSGDVGQKPHLIYLSTMDPAVVGTGGQISDISGWDCTDVGAVASIKYLNGCHVGTVSGRNTAGVLETLTVNDSTIDGVVSYGDTYPSTGDWEPYGSLSIMNSDRIEVSGVLLSMAAMVHGRAIFVDGTSSDVTIRKPRIITRRTAATLTAGGSDVTLKGYRNRIEDPQINGTNKAAGAAILLDGTGSDGQVIAPRIVGPYQAKVKVTATHARPWIEYDPYNVLPSRDVASAKVLDVAAGIVPTIRDRSIGQAVPVGFSDTFDRPDITGLICTDEGKTWAPAGIEGAGVGSWVIDGNAARYNGGSARSVVLAEGGKADGTLTAVIGALPTGDEGLAIRATDTSNYIVVIPYYSAGDYRVRIVKRVAGTATQVAVSTVQAVAGDTLTVTLSGTTVSASLNGTQVVTGTVAEFTTITKHGLLGLSIGKVFKANSLTFV